MPFTEEERGRAGHRSAYKLVRRAVNHATDVVNHLGTRHGPVHRCGIAPSEKLKP